MIERAAPRRPAQRRGRARRVAASPAAQRRSRAPHAVAADRRHEPVRALHPPAGADGAAQRGDRRRRRDRLSTSIPVAALPSYNTPVINVSAQLPGASPETMATSVALHAREAVPDDPRPGRHQLDQHARRHLGDARVRRRAATSTPPRSTCRRRCCARSAQLPHDMTVPPSYRKVNPADAPVLLHRADVAVAQPVGPERLRRAPDLADAVDARRRRPGQHLRPEALRGARARAARRAGGAQHQPRRADQRACARPTPTRRSARSRGRRRR